MKIKFPSIVLLHLILLVSCSSEQHKKQTKNNNTATSYKIAGKIKNHNNDILYLNIISSDTVIRKDSCLITTNSFNFKGEINFPCKAFLQLKNYTNYYPFILSNENINIELNEKQLTNSSINNSTINSDFLNIKKQSAAIFREIDYLYPQLQKARMENNAALLVNINQQIDNITEQNKLFLYHYISENNENPLTVLLLNDLWQSDNKDSIVLQKLGSKLPEKFQENLDFAIQ